MNMIIEAIENDKKYFNALKKAFNNYVNMIIKKVDLSSINLEEELLDTVNIFIDNEELIPSLPKYLPFKNKLINLFKKVFVKYILKLIEER